MTDKIDKRVCVVTGGSLGIGAAICQQFANHQEQVINLDIQPSSNAMIEYMECDVRDAEQVSRAMNAVIDKFGRIDVLVSNAGMHLSGTIETTTDEQFERLFELNVKGAIAATKAVLPIMRAQQQGALIFMASDQALVAKANSFAYNLSKAALASIAKTTALDYAKFNIRANAVCPGTIETPLYHNAIERYVAKSGADINQVHQQERAAQPLNRLGKPEEVAALVHFLASPQASFITGSLQVIDGGYTAQ